ncbi:hypothetical protein F5Y12DRAFT_148456 [Xylaria sp. FL1777]|nr:hypothetical protein F5Y12DRAFT_148456 [Xylaria sp. FL1777]
MANNTIASVLEDRDFGRISPMNPRSTTRTSTTFLRHTQNGRNRFPDFIDILSYVSILYRQNAQPMEVLADWEMESIDSGAIFHVSFRKNESKTGERSQVGPLQQRVVMKRSPALKFEKDGTVHNNNKLSQLAAHGMLRELQVLTIPDIRQHKNVVDILGVAWSYEPCVNSFKYVFFSKIDLIKTQPDACPEMGLVLEQAECTLDGFLRSESDVLFATKRDICRDIARGLAALHKCGIIHGDVKLANILMFKDIHSKWIAKVADFSHSQFNTGRSTGLIGGTTKYAAPEWKKELTTDLLMKTDIYYFGIVVGSTVTGVDIIDRILEKVGAGIPEERSLELNRLKEQDSLKATILDEFYNIMSTDLTLTSGDILLVELWLNDTLSLQPERRHLDSVLGAQNGDNRLDKSSCILETSNEDLASRQLSEVFDTPKPWDPDLIDIPYQALNGLSNVLKRQIVATLTKTAKNTERNQTKVRIAAAAFELCICYAAGFGVELDRTEARDWLCLAAREGELTAQAVSFRLLEAFGLGDTVDPNHIDAWLVTAGAKGSWTAIESLKDRQSTSYPNALQAYRKSTSIYPEDNAYDFGALLYDYNNMMTLESSFYITSRNEHGQTFLHWIVMQGLDNILDFLSTNDVLSSTDLNIQDRNGDTALIYACRSGWCAIAKKLIALGASATLVNASGENALHYLYTIEAEHVDSLASLLVEHGADITQESAEKITNNAVFDVHFKVPGCPILRAITMNALTPATVLINLRKQYYSTNTAREVLLWKSTCYKIIGWACRLNNYRVLRMIPQFFPDVLESLRLPKIRLRMHNATFTLASMWINGCVSNNPSYGFDFPEAFWRCMYHGRDYSTSLGHSFDALQALGINFQTTKCGKQRNALFFAIERGHAEVVSILLQSCTNSDQFSPFGAVEHTDNPRILESLTIDEGTSTSQSILSSCTNDRQKQGLVDAILASITAGKHDIFRLLLQARTSEALRMGDYFPVDFIWFYKCRHHLPIEDAVTSYFPRLHLYLAYESIQPNPNYPEPDGRDFAGCREISYEILPTRNRFGIQALRRINLLVVDGRLNYALLYMNSIAGSQHRDLCFANTLLGLLNAENIDTAHGWAPRNFLEHCWLGTSTPGLPLLTAASQQWDDMAALMIQNGAEPNAKIYHPRPTNMNLILAILFSLCGFHRSLKPLQYLIVSIHQRVWESSSKFPVIEWLLKYDTILKSRKRLLKPHQSGVNRSARSQALFLLNLLCARAIRQSHVDTYLLMLCFAAIGKESRDSASALTHREIWKLLVQGHKSQCPGGLHTMRKRPYWPPYNLVKIAVLHSDPLALEALIDLGYSPNGWWANRLWITPLDMATIILGAQEKPTEAFVSNSQADAMNCYKLLSSQPNIHSGLGTMAAIQLSLSPLILSVIVLIPIVVRPPQSLIMPLPIVIKIAIEVVFINVVSVCLNFPWPDGHPIDKRLVKSILLPGLGTMAHQSDVEGIASSSQALYGPGTRFVQRVSQWIETPRIPEGAGILPR